MTDATSAPPPDSVETVETRELRADDASASLIGRASATEREPNTSDRFSFWVRPSLRVNPFDIVEAEHLEGSRTYGLVTSISHITDATNHLSNFISNDFGESLEEPNTPRQGANVADVAVLSNDRDIYMPVQSEARVGLADERGIHQALGINDMEEKEKEESRPVRIPAGLIRMSNGADAVTYLDADYVIGPEAGHVNVSGISGLATKTSYVTFLIQSTLQTLGSDDIAVILLNVKYDDLLHLHEPDELAPEQVRMWTRLGLKPEPFPSDRVHYLLPLGKNTAVTGRPNSFDVPRDRPYGKYAYTLGDAAEKLDILFSSVPDQWGTMSALVGEVSQGIASGLDPWRGVTTWHGLLHGPPLVRNGVPQAFGAIQLSSVGRFVRILRRTVETQQTGIFVPQRSQDTYSIEQVLSRMLQGGHTFVVDIAKLQPDEQTLVFGDILRTIYGLYSGETLIEEQTPESLPKRVIIFVDELNKYAPAHARGMETPLLDQILDIAERGRSFGIILFSAEQFMSAVHTRVIGNAGTRLIGRTDSAELHESAYGFLDRDVRQNLTRLDKGELVLSHAVYRRPVKIGFPRLPFVQGRR